MEYEKSYGGIKVIKDATTYKSLDFDFAVINQCLLDITDKKRSNLFTWNGQFSPQFVEALIDNFAAKEFVVADPFLGSGTVLYECARKGIAASGVELNPSAYYMAKVYEFCNIILSERYSIIESLDTIINNACDESDSLSALCEIAATSQNAQISNTISLIIVLLDLFNNHFSIDLLKEKWEKIRKTIYELPESKSEILASLADARSLPIANNSVDLIITSPPYINVFNYHQKYRRSVEALGYDVLKIAKKEIGSNRKNRGNRLFTVIQYCIDMAFSIREIIRICKPNSRIIFVVGRESNVLSTSFCNSQLIYNIANGIFDLPIILKQQRVFKNRYGQDIYEDILHFCNSDDKINKISTLQIRELSRQVAVDVLISKINLGIASEKMLSQFQSAIDNASSIFESEGLQ